MALLLNIFFTASLLILSSCAGHEHDKRQSVISQKQTNTDTYPWPHETKDVASYED
jgi:hypothetical protein